MDGARPPRRCITPALASVLDAFAEEDTYGTSRCHTDGTVLWFGRSPIASRDRLGRIYVLAEHVAWSRECHRHLMAVRRTFPDSLVSVAIPLPTLEPAA